jgi:hypothetical protein
MRYDSRAESGMSAKEIFEEINVRQIIAQMFHREMSVYFSFLGLQGYKRLHQYRYFEESCENSSLMYWIVDHHNMLIKNGEVPSVAIIPNEWYTVSRLAVGQNTKTNAVKDAMESWKEWEVETLHTYEKYAKILVDSGDILDYKKVCCMVEDVSMEVKKLERMIEELQLVNYDSVYIAETQKRIHDDCKEKMHM